MKVMILTTENCGVCKMLGMMLDKDDALKEKQDNIEWVKQEDYPTRFKTLMKSVNSSTVPTVLFAEGTEVLESHVNVPVGQLRAKIKSFLG